MEEGLKNHGITSKTVVERKEMSYEEKEKVFNYAFKMNEGEEDVIVKL